MRMGKSVAAAVEKVLPVEPESLPLLSLSTSKEAEEKGLPLWLLLLPQKMVVHTSRVVYHPYHWYFLYSI